MPQRVHLILPLFAALLYVLGAMLIRRAADLGAGAWRTTVVNNLTSAAGFSTLLLLGGEPVVLSRLWQPATVAVLYLGGQVMSFLALTRGDVSVATPVFSVKIIFVAIFSSMLLGEEVGWRVWLAAGLSVLAVRLLHRGPARRAGGGAKPLGLTIAAAGGAAVCYSLFDVLVRRWSPAWGVGRFLPIMMGFAAIYSLPLMPLAFKRRHGAEEARSWRWLLPGSLAITAQAMCFITALAVYGDVAAANIVYATRALWSVLAVWGLGHWFHNTERRQGGQVMGRRLAGATLLLAAIALVLT
jgi:drug/metabolite transporter (DMT)-like permease